LGARSEHQQQLGLCGKAAQRGIEQYRADRLARRRASRFARDDSIDIACGQHASYRIQYRALACALAALKGNQSSACDLIH